MEPRPQLDVNQNWNPGGDIVIRNKHLYLAIVSSMVISGSEAMHVDVESSDLEPKTDLDGHANMPIVGVGAAVLAEHNGICEISPYSPDHEPMLVPLVDAAVKYESPFDGRVHILVIQNALYVLSMTYNLLPPFMMKEA